MFEQWSDVDSLIKRSTPSAKLVQDIDDALELLKFLILHIFGQGYSLATQGSFEQDLITPTSDIDVVINDNAEPLLGRSRQVIVLETLDAQLRDLRGSDPDIEKIRVCKRILKARVPIIRLVFRDRLFIDVSAGDKMRGRPDRVVRNLVSHGIGSKLFCRAVKVWATTHRLNDTHMGGLSSFAWVLLCIFYLQTKCGLPAFRSMEHWGNESENPQRLQSFITGFFVWLEVEFTGRRTCKSIDVMTATMSELMGSGPLQIKVPMQPEDNAARCLRADKWWHMILPMIRKTREHVVNNKHGPVKKVPTKEEIATPTNAANGPPYTCACDDIFRKLRAFVRHQKICPRWARAHRPQCVVIDNSSTISVTSSGTSSSSDGEIAATGSDEPPAKRRRMIKSEFANNPWEALMEQNEGLGATGPTSSNNAAPFARSEYWKALTDENFWLEGRRKRRRKHDDGNCAKGGDVTEGDRHAGQHVGTRKQKQNKNKDALQATADGGKKKKNKKKNKGPKGDGVKKKDKKQKQKQNKNKDAPKETADGGKKKKKKKKNKGPKGDGVKKKDKKQKQNKNKDAPKETAGGDKKKKRKKKRRPKGGKNKNQNKNKDAPQGTAGGHKKKKTGPKGGGVKKKDKNQSIHTRVKVKCEWYIAKNIY